MNLVRYYTKNKWLTATVITIMSFLGLAVILPLKAMGFGNNVLLYASIGLRFLYIVLMLWFFSKKIKLKELSNFKWSLRAGLMVLVFMLPSLISFVKDPLFIPRNPKLFLNMLMVGPYEELINRVGILVFLSIALLNQGKSIKGGLIISSVFFGGIHIVNLLMGNDFLSTIVQVASAIAAGFMLGYVVIATRNIWIACLIHTLYNTNNYISEFGETFEEQYQAFVELGAVLLMLAVALLLFKGEYWKVFAERLKIMEKG